MRVPLKLMLDLGRYMRRRRRAGEKYFPLVLMLEPLHACNLACIGCGRIVEYKDTIRDQMPLDEALGAAEEAEGPLEVLLVEPAGTAELDRPDQAGLQSSQIRGIEATVVAPTNATKCARPIQVVTAKTGPVRSRQRAVADAIAPTASLPSRTANMAAKDNNQFNAHHK